MLGCVGLDPFDIAQDRLAAVQGNVAELEYAHGAGDQQDLHHQGFDLFQKPFAKGVQCVVVGVLVSAYKEKGD